MGSEGAGHKCTVGSSQHQAPAKFSKDQVSGQLLCGRELGDKIKARGKPSETAVIEAMDGRCVHRGDKLE